MLECRARTLLKKCNCIPYYYPRLDLLFAVKGEGNNATRSNHPNTNICTWHGLQCLQNSSGIYCSLAKSHDHLSASNACCLSDMLYSVRSSGMEDGADCRCPSSCSRTTYSAALSYAALPSKRSSTERYLLLHCECIIKSKVNFATQWNIVWQNII